MEKRNAKVKNLKCRKSTKESIIRKHHGRKLCKSKAKSNLASLKLKGKITIKTSRLEYPQKSGALGREVFKEDRTQVACRGRGKGARRIKCGEGGGRARRQWNGEG